MVLRGTCLSTLLLLLLEWPASPITVQRYEESRWDHPDADVPGTMWAQPQPGTRRRRSSVSRVNDGPFEAVNFCFPYFTLDQAAVAISPNGFLSLKVSPLCVNSPPADPPFAFCNSNTSGFYKVVQTPYGTYGGDHPLIGVIVEDLDPSASPSANVWFWNETKYQPPESTLVVEWRDVPIAGQPDRTFTMQAELLGNGTLFLRYRRLWPPMLIGDGMGLPPTVGLVWTDLQRRVLAYPTSQTTVIRLNPYVDGCVAYTSCDACLNATSLGWDDAAQRAFVVGCQWCGNLNLCVPGDLVADFCSNADLFVDRCTLPDVHGYFYTQSIQYGLGDQYTPVKAGQTLGRLSLYLPFFSGMPDRPAGCGTTMVDVSTAGFVAFSQYTLLMQQCRPQPTCLSALENFNLTASVFRTKLMSSTTDVWLRYGASGDGRQRVIQWSSAYVASGPGERYAAQLRLCTDGSITVRFGPVPMPGASCAAGAVWAAFPEPFIGLIRTSARATASIVPWQLLRSGAVVSFAPILGCPVDCWNGACNHHTRTCQCLCQHGVCGDPVSTGVCTSCHPGWAGLLCNIPCTCDAAHGVCSEGLTGTGHCAGPCAAGFAGPDCDVCQPYHYGPACAACQCDNRTVCFDGLAGNGTCGNCSSGWSGPDCAVCAAGHAGLECLPCACAHGKCDDGVAGMGLCLSCDPGWAGPTCNISCNCPGPHTNCFDGVQGTGQCYCDAGWSITRGCLDCDAQHYGPNCDLCLCQNGQCDSGVNGSGLCSCNAGYFGRNCQPPQSSNNAMGAIIIIIIFTLMLLCGCTIVVVFFVLRKKQIPVGALIVERWPGGERDVIPVPHVPVQSSPVQGIPLQQIPLSGISVSHPRGYDALPGSGPGSPRAAADPRDVTPILDDPDVEPTPPA